MNHIKATIILISLTYVSVEACIQAGSCDFDYANPDFDWPKLLCEHIECDKTHYFEQSPVNIASEVEDPSLSELSFSGYTDTTVYLYDTGHVLQVEYPVNYSATLNNKYNLLQFHFHSGNENTVKNDRHALTIHLVHRDPVSGELAVVDFFIAAVPGAANNSFFAPIIGALSELAENRSEKIPIVLPGFSDIFADLKSVNQHGYYNFNGSLTTPPCTEGVNWFVMRTALNISGLQYSEILKHWNNYDVRPIQRELYDVRTFNPAFGQITPDIIDEVSFIETAPWIWFIVVLIILVIIATIVVVVLHFKGGSGKYKKPDGSEP